MKPPFALMRLLFVCVFFWFVSIFILKGSILIISLILVFFTLFVDIFQFQNFWLYFFSMHCSNFLCTPKKLLVYLVYWFFLQTVCQIMIVEVPSAMQGRFHSVEVIAANATDMVGMFLWYLEQFHEIQLNVRIIVVNNSTWRMLCDLFY